MIGNNEPATNKIHNYSNIKVSVEKVKDEKIKQDVITILNRAPDEELQTTHNNSDVLDMILENFDTCTYFLSRVRWCFEDDAILGEIRAIDINILKSLIKYDDGCLRNISNILNKENIRFLANDGSLVKKLLEGNKQQCLAIFDKLYQKSLYRFNNIRGVIERIQNLQIKQETVKSLYHCSNKELQEINDQSNLLERMLNAIEDGRRYNNNIKFSVHSLFTIFYSNTDSTFRRLKNINLDALECVLKYDIIIYDDVYLYALNDCRFNHFTQDISFFSTVIKMKNMASFISLLEDESQIDDCTFYKLMENKDLILVYHLMANEKSEISYFIAKQKSEFDHFMACHKPEINLKELTSCTNRQSMIGKLYSLQQKGELFCDKESLDLIIANWQSIQQLFHNQNNIDGIVKKLQHGDCTEIKVLLAKGIIQQNADYEFDYNSLVEVNYFGKNPKKLETLSAIEFMNNDNQDLFVKYYSKEYYEYKKIHRKDVAEKAEQRKIKLDQVQITPAVEQGTAQQL